ncbi:MULTISPECIES: 4-hydroxy-tetrahydrodipicolinate synthase [Staphylococcus]|uniref:4-hydroxy-tetrahydrodipicolinate synthase n=1 Tax=Staphylococcus xylosus TaxID=1288 RepID=A0A418IKL5_STAXY|nr:MULTISPECIES: 4-hydroxy-tetrahydrodipicolinate synthase [Staphylococcus]MBF0814696.1 4-hydroxy-tetrahydrodipicolinate synthase [Staphylococcus saprophyticus]MDW8543383.1 4-hydroxy-tetrahydrodipicolinate synthase [Staphylococcus sp. KG4-1]MRF38436.1 4-hydroxy-tetrahydrodipicolinate synthase [Staphylococcus sp. KY49P]MDW8562807.1 4-hydroxy-tetrahydrodipicolinate synthase [Staphylococcus sp. KG4-3]NQE00209.1 4-hydroxy-tetrahydrodipicolinate synthase [Staphylococcus xylosus]
MYRPIGMIPAMPTPLNEDESINFSGYEKLINHLIDGGVHCLLAGGSTGEYSMMSTEERKEVLKAAVDYADGRVPIMAGTSEHRLNETIELTKYAEEIGADCALIITPYYMQTSEEGIKNYYEQVAKATNIGIVIYHYPGATNVTLTPEFIAELSEIEGIVGVKNTTDQEHTCKVIALTKDNEGFSVLTGSEHLILPTLAVGGDGATGIIHNLVPDQIVEMYDLFKNKKDIDGALKINQRLLPLYDYVEAEPVPGPIKAGLDLIGLEGGNVRDPLVEASNELKEKMRETLNRLDYKLNI